MLCDTAQLLVLGASNQRKLKSTPNLNACYDVNVQLMVLGVSTQLPAASAPSTRHT